MSELNKQMTITSIFGIGNGNRLAVRGHIAELLKSFGSPIVAFKIETIRLVSYGLINSPRCNMIPGTGILETLNEGRATRQVYHLQTEDDTSLAVTYTPETQTVKVDKTNNVVDVELAITIVPQDFKPSPDGFIYISIPVRDEYRNGNSKPTSIKLEHGSFDENDSVLKGTWDHGFGSFEPAFDAKGNIIAFNLINKP